MQQGIFPQRLKRAVVIPISKLSPPSSLENDLRPISLTSQVSNVLEGWHGLNAVSLPNKSTTHALVYLLHSIITVRSMLC
jgi:hypothetical protein